MANHMTILRAIKANNKKLDLCPRHRFSGERVPLGYKYTCLECGGRISGINLMYYIHGYEAGGGNCDDIYPGWRDEENPLPKTTD